MSCNTFRHPSGPREAGGHARPDERRTARRGSGRRLVCRGARCFRDRLPSARGTGRALPRGRRGRRPTPSPGADDVRGATLPSARRSLPARPVQQPRPPLMLAGHGPRMLRIIAELGDAWNSFGTPAEIRQRNLILDEHCRAIGRDPATLTRSSLRLGYTDSERVLGRRAGWELGREPGERRTPSDRRSLGVRPGLPRLHRDVSGSRDRPLRDRRAAHRAASRDGAVCGGHPARPSDLGITLAVLTAR